ncbi:MAG: phosphoribosyltransferase family protein [Nitrospiraceae bacterium]|nr:phosphoribosyltransferase family protein [Nitrospiraceae bacterium]
MFRDRTDAGAKLAAALRHYKGQNVIVLGLPRGGVVVAAQVAEFLSAPLDVLIVRKIGVPWQPELAMGAVSETGAAVFNDEVISTYNIAAQEVERETALQKKEIERRIQLYRKGGRLRPLKGMVCILVDDGLATGATMRAAISALKEEGLKKLVAAVPVAPPETARAVRQMVDEFVCLQTDPFFTSLGSYYYNFDQVPDEEVVGLLEESAKKIPEPGDPVTKSSDVRIPAGRIQLDGDLQVPRGARSVVIFAHGSGSSRFSPRNKFVANILREAGMGTLLFDLLTPEEESFYEMRFDINLLSGRLETATKWLMENPLTEEFQIGYFGASTGAAAAIQAAAVLEDRIGAVVSRGGRPDLASEEALRKITSPTLLIIGEFDRLVIELNKRAFESIGAEKKIEIVPGATHLFEEPGALEKAARLASGWFTKYLQTVEAKKGK